MVNWMRMNGRTTDVWGIEGGVVGCSINVVLFKWVNLKSRDIWVASALIYRMHPRRHDTWWSACSSTSSPTDPNKNFLHWVYIIIFYYLIFRYNELKIELKMAARMAITMNSSVWPPLSLLHSQSSWYRIVGYGSGWVDKKAWKLM